MVSSEKAVFFNANFFGLVGRDTRAFLSSIRFIANRLARLGVPIPVLQRADGSLSLLSPFVVAVIRFVVVVVHFRRAH